MPMACVYAACIVQVTVAAGVPRDAKPIVSGDFLSRLVEFPRVLSLLVVIVLVLFVTLLHVSEYENAFPGLRLVKTALYDTMLLSFRLPAVYCFGLNALFPNRHSFLIHLCCAQFILSLFPPLSSRHAYEGSGSFAPPQPFDADMYVRCIVQYTHAI